MSPSLDALTSSFFLQPFGFNVTLHLPLALGSRDGGIQQRQSRANLSLNWDRMRPLLGSAQNGATRDTNNDRVHELSPAATTK